MTNGEILSVPKTDLVVLQQPATMKVYLSGPIRGLSFGDATDWRADVADQLAPHVQCLSPMRFKEFLRAEEKIKGEYAAYPLGSPSGITTRDRWDTCRADAVLMNLLGAEKVSIGTMIEAGWADAWRVPIVLVMEDEGNMHEHPILTSLAGYRVDTLAKGVGLIKALLWPEGVDDG